MGIKERKASYIPERGDIVWLTFNPQPGHEQSGKRPALTISPLAYNRATGLALFCPITSKIKHYPFEVVLPKGSKISGAILSDQIKSLDWRARGATFAATLSSELFDEVIEKVRIIINSP